ncbi:MAG: cyclic nucleotide-binding domain-containing protein [Anaerolineaceae bacterium]|nr:cyclic nucleotide-binding domain-containing protein [Anaerolineaceae bacterium]
MFIQELADDKPFPGLTDLQKQQIAPFFQTWESRAEEIIFEQGQLARSFYLINDGQVLIRYKPYDGPALDVTRIGSGQVFGWSAALGHSTYSSSAISIIDSAGLQISKRNLQVLCKQYPDTGTIIIRHLADLIAKRMGNTHATVFAILMSSVDANP